MNSVSKIENNVLHLDHETLADLPPRNHAKLINSLSGFKSANLIGTIDKDGLTNLAIFSSVVHLGASPALVGFITRPHSVERHTLENIMQTECFTINQVNQTFWQQAHQTSARYTKAECEFDRCGLSKEFVKGLKAPFVAESKLRFALKLKDVMPIPLNKTQLVIGEITDIFCEQKAIKEDGYIDIETLNTVCVSGLDSYHVTNRLSRLSYAKPNVDPTKLSINGKNEV